MLPLNLSEEDSKNFEPSYQVLNGAAIGKHNDGSDESKNSSVVVFGSYESVTSNFLSTSSFNNASYFINLLNTLSDREDVSVVIEGKDPSAHELGITSTNDILFPSILVRFVIPIAVLIIGIVVWIRRRHK